MKTKLLLSALLMLCLSTFMHAQGNLPPWLIELAPDKEHVLFSGPGGVYDHAKLDSLIALYKERTAWYHYPGNNNSYSLPLDTLEKYEILMITMRHSTGLSPTLSLPAFPEDDVYNGKTIVIHFEGSEVLDTIFVEAVGPSQLVQIDCYDSGKTTHRDTILVDQDNPDLIVYRTSYQDDYVRQCEGLITLKDGSTVLPEDTLFIEVNPSELKQEGASLNDAIRWDGSKYTPAPVNSIEYLTESIRVTVCNDTCDYKTLTKAFEFASFYTTVQDSVSGRKTITIDIERNSDGTPTELNETLTLRSRNYSNVILTSDGDSVIWNADNRTDSELTVEYCTIFEFNNLLIIGKNASNAQFLRFRRGNGGFALNTEVRNFNVGYYLGFDGSYVAVNLDAKDCGTGFIFDHSSVYMLSSTIDNCGTSIFTNGNNNAYLASCEMPNYINYGLYGDSGMGYILSVSTDFTKDGTARDTDVYLDANAIGFITCTNSPTTFGSNVPKNILTNKGILAVEGEPSQANPVLINTTPETSNFTANMGEAHLVDISGGSITVTAPASPSTNDVFEIRLVNYNLGGNTCTIDMSTDNYLGQTTLPDASHIINTTGGGASFQYIGGPTGWTLKSAH